MATYNCVELANAASANPTMLESSEVGGKLRISKFSFVVPVGNAALGTTLAMGLISRGGQVHAIYAVWETMSTAGGTAGISIGDVLDADRLVVAYALEGAGQAWLTMREDVASVEPTTPPVIGTGYEYTADTIILGTVTGEAWAAGKYLRGFIVWSCGN